MVSDSSKPTDDEIEQLLRDNDMGGAPLNVHDKKVHAFPYVEVLLKLNERINSLEKSRIPTS